MDSNRLLLITIIAIALIGGGTAGWFQCSQRLLAPPYTALGTIKSHAFVPASTEFRGSSGSMRARASIKIDEYYFVEIRLNEGEVVKTKVPVSSISNFPIGQRVQVTCERRGIESIWQKIWVTDIKKLSD